jgi:hypothetical protein
MFEKIKALIEDLPVILVIYFVYKMYMANFAGNWNAFGWTMIIFILILFYWIMRKD